MANCNCADIRQGIVSGMAALASGDVSKAFDIAKATAPLVAHDLDQIKARAATRLGLRRAG